MNIASSSAEVVRESKAPRIIALIALAILLMFAITGCESNAPSALILDPSGTYKLISVDGRTVPCQLIHEKTSMPVKSGTFTIFTNGICVSLIIFSVAGHPEMNPEMKATYTPTERELTMKWQGVGITKGGVKGDTFFMDNEGMTFSYNKSQINNRF